MDEIEQKVVAELREENHEEILEKGGGSLWPHIYLGDLSQNQGEHWEGNGQIYDSSFDGFNILFVEKWAVFPRPGVLHDLVSIKQFEFSEVKCEVKEKYDGHLDSDE